MPTYTIRVRGHLASHWAAWLEGLTITHADDGTTTLHGSLADQSALFGVLTRIHNLNVPLLTVTCSGIGDTADTTTVPNEKMQEE